MLTFTDINKDPFRLFFPLGAVMAILGAAPWLTAPWMGGYPVDLHRKWMIGGFLLAFVGGFLMTAVPRFTGGSFASTKEVWWALASWLVVGTSAWVGSEFWFFLGSSLFFAGLISFLGKRFKMRTANPPFTFLFMGVGLLSWFISCLVLLFGTLWPLAQNLERIFLDVYFFGALISLVLGIGGRLIPGILGWREIVHAHREIYEKPKPFLQTVPPHIYALVLIYFLGFLLEYFGLGALGRLARAAVVVIIALVYWRAYRIPKVKSVLTWMIWVSGLSFVVGSVIWAILPEWGTHGLHIIFVSGFGLLTFMVSARVILAHGASSTDLERRSVALALIGSFIFFSALTRVAAWFTPKIYLSHLSYAAGLWLIAVVVWLFVFLRRLFLDILKESSNSRTHK